MVFESLEEKLMDRCMYYIMGGKEIGPPSIDQNGVTLSYTVDDKYKDNPYAVVRSIYKATTSKIPSLLARLVGRPGNKMSFTYDKNSGNYTFTINVPYSKWYDGLFRPADLEQKIVITVGKDGKYTVNVTGKYALEIALKTLRVISQYLKTQGQPASANNPALIPQNIPAQAQVAAGP